MQVSYTADSMDLPDSSKELLESAVHDAADSGLAVDVAGNVLMESSAESMGEVIDLTGLGVDTPAVVKSVKEQLRTTPGSGIGYGLLRRAGMLTGPEPQIGFNYLGKMSTAEFGDELRAAGWIPDAGIDRSAEPRREVRAAWPEPIRRRAGWWCGRRARMHETHRGPWTSTSPRSPPASAKRPCRREVRFAAPQVRCRT